MEHLLPVNLAGRSRRMRDFVADDSRNESVRRADALVRINLPPLMGRRDAALDAAAQFLLTGAFDGLTPVKRSECYWIIARLLRSACDDSKRIYRMLNSPDTRSRERKLLVHVIVLDSFGAALANFYELGELLFDDEEQILHDSMSELDEDEKNRASARMSDVEADLLLQLRDCVTRAHFRLMRYRSYASKSFSQNNADRYRRAYDAIRTRCDELASKFSSETINS